MELLITQGVLKGIFKECRKEHNLTQGDLGEILGTTQQGVSRIENGTHNPSLYWVEKALFEMGYKLTIEKMEESDED